MGNTVKIAMANMAFYAVEGLSWVAVGALLPVSIPAALAWGREFLFKPLEWTSGVRVWREGKIAAWRSGASAAGISVEREVPVRAKSAAAAKTQSVEAKVSNPEVVMEVREATPQREAVLDEALARREEEAGRVRMEPEGAAGLMAMAGRLGQSGRDAASKERVSAEVAMLVAAGTDVDAVDSEGNTALHYAAMHANAALVHALLDSGAKPCLLDAQGDTPLEVFQAKWESETSVFVCEAFARLAAQEERWAFGSELGEEERA
jgi:hypothetical protein